MEELIVAVLILALLFNMFMADRFIKGGLPLSFFLASWAAITIFALLVVIYLPACFM